MKNDSTMSEAQLIGGDVETTADTAHMMARRSDGSAAPAAETRRN
jgi:hypothetical protein